MRCGIPGSTCTGSCRSCGLTGTQGTCTNIAVGTDPFSECQNYVCNGTGATLDASGRLLLSVPAEHQIVVVDLDTGSFFAVDWQGTGAGPMDVELLP